MLQPRTPSTLPFLSSSYYLLLPLAALLVLGPGCRSAPSPGPDRPSATAATPARPIPDPFVDSFLKAEIEDRGSDLVGAHRVATVGKLKGQLQRSSCTLALPAPVDRPLELPELYRRSVPGTLVISRLYHCPNCGRYHSAADASAFAITADGVCVTNYHVIERAGDDHYLVVADAWGDAWPVTEVLAASRRDDIAILRVETLDRPLSPIPLRSGTPAGATVAVLSHPAGHFYAFSPGHLSRRAWRYNGMTGDLRDLSAGDPHAETADRSSLEKLTRTIEITADYGVGSSGGPVLDASGNVVGMVSNTQAVYADPKEKRYIQMNFHICVPAESIRGLIREE